MIITQDTVWRSGQTYALSETLQITKGATLHVQPGAIINGNGYSIQAYGTLEIAGSADDRVNINNTSIGFGINNYGSPGYVSVKYADIKGGSFLDATGYAVYGSFSLENSVVQNVSGFYIWYPTADSKISDNLFVGSQGLSIGTSGVQVDVSGNLFYNSFGGYNGTASIVNWASYRSTQIVNNNSFIGNIPAIEYPKGYDSVSVAAQNNWFGTTDESQIKSKILDKSSDLSRGGYIDYSPSLDPSDPARFDRAKVGTDGDDLIQTIGREWIYSGRGNDTIIVNSDDAKLDGGAGLDTAVFAAPSWSYEVKLDQSHGQLALYNKIKGGSVQALGIEKFSFTNGYVTFSGHDYAGQIYAIYDGLLGRAPDTFGLVNWTACLKAGMSLHDVAAGFLNSAEGQARAGAFDNATFIDQIYQANLHRSADPEGKSNWLSALEQGMSRADVALGFALSDEHMTSLKSVFDAGIFVSDSDASNVARLYYSILDHGPDASGLQGWTSAVKGGTSLHDVAAAFLNSAEYEVATTGLTDAQFVDKMYNQILERSGDKGGLQAWNAHLDHGGARGVVIDGFTDSFEFQGKYAGLSSKAYVEELYEHVLNRNGDSDGVQNWANALDSHALSRTDVAHAFTGSAEFQANYVGPSNADFVDDLYENALGRHADASGLQVWTDALAHGTSRADVAVALAQSAEAQQHLVDQIEAGWHLA